MTKEIHSLYYMTNLHHCPMFMQRRNVAWWAQSWMVSSACKNCCLRYFPSTSLWRHNYCCWRSNNQEGRVDIPLHGLITAVGGSNNQEGRVDIPLHDLITAVGDPIIKRGESISHGLTLFLMLHVPIQYLKFKCHGFQMSYVMVFLRF